MVISLNRRSKIALTVALALGLTACNDAQSKTDKSARTEAAVINTAPDKAQAIAFINDAEAKMAELSIESNRA